MLCVSTTATTTITKKSSLIIDTLNKMKMVFTEVCLVKINVIVSF